METTSLVQSITDEQIAEIEALVLRYKEREFIRITDNVLVLALISRLRAAERDAARYRYIRSRSVFDKVNLQFGMGDGTEILIRWKDADRHIDDAMKGDQQ